MKNISISHSGSKAKLFAMIGAVILIFGCRTVVFDPRGRMVPDAKRIALPESGERAGVFKNEDLTLAYKLTRTSGQLYISGQIRFAERIAENFPLIQYFHLSVMLIDAQGKVLDVAGLISAAYYRAQSALIAGSPISFKTPVAITDNTNSIAFSYTGKAYDNTERDRGSIEFWEYPVY
jgi:hypothetical protein